MVKRKADWTPTMEQRAGLPASSAVSVLQRVIYGLVPAGARGSIPGAPTALAGAVCRSYVAMTALKLVLLTLDGKADLEQIPIND